MVTESVEARVLALVAEERGVPVEKVRLEARLYHDLGMDGDDAAEFFDGLHAEFGTDLSALNEVWSEHFNDEGMSLGSGLWLVVPAVIGGFTASAMSIWPGWGVVLAVLLAVAGGLAWNRWGPPDPLKAITVRDVVHAVEAGAWPRSPA